MAEKYYRFDNDSLNYKQQKNLFEAKSQIYNRFSFFLSWTCIGDGISRFSI